MSDRKQDARVIHPLVLERLGAEWVAAALSVADDLRSGVIPPEDLNMAWYQKSGPCCVGCHMARRLGRDVLSDPGLKTLPDYEGLRLFSALAPSDPLIVAHALENFVATCRPDWGRP